MDEPLILKNHGLSDACLANLAFEANDEVEEPEMSLQELVRVKPFDTTETMQPAQVLQSFVMKKVHRTQEMDRTPGYMIKVSKREYESLPTYMKCLASCKDLVCAVEKVNSTLNTKQKNQGMLLLRRR